MTAGIAGRDQNHIGMHAACDAPARRALPAGVALEPFPCLRIRAVDRTLAEQGAAELDAEAPAAELVKLWQERVGLMRELMNARATRARYVGL